MFWRKQENDNKEVTILNYVSDEELIYMSSAVIEDLPHQLAYKFFLRKEINTLNKKIFRISSKECDNKYLKDREIKLYNDNGYNDIKITDEQLINILDLFFSYKKSKIHITLYNKNNDQYSKYEEIDNKENQVSFLIYYLKLKNHELENSIKFPAQKQTNTKIDNISILIDGIECIINQNGKISYIKKDEYLRDDDFKEKSIILNDKLYKIVVT